MMPVIVGRSNLVAALAVGLARDVRCHTYRWTPPDRMHGIEMDRERRRAGGGSLDPAKSRMYAEHCMHAEEDHLCERLIRRHQLKHSHHQGLALAILFPRKLPFLPLRSPSLFLPVSLLSTS